MIKLTKGDPTPFTGYVVMDTGVYSETDQVRVCHQDNVYSCVLQIQANYIKNKEFVLETATHKTEAFNPKLETLTEVVIEKEVKEEVKVEEPIKIKEEELKEDNG